MTYQPEPLPFSQASAQMQHTLFAQATDTIERLRIERDAWKEEAQQQRQIAEELQAAVNGYASNLEEQLLAQDVALGEPENVGGLLDLADPTAPVVRQLRDGEIVED